MKKFLSLYASTLLTFGVVGIASAAETAEWAGPIDCGEKDSVCIGDDSYDVRLLCKGDVSNVVGLKAVDLTDPTILQGAVVRLDEGGEPAELICTYAFDSDTMTKLAEKCDTIGVSTTTSIDLKTEQDPTCLTQ